MTEEELLDLIKELSNWMKKVTLCEGEMDMDAYEERSNERVILLDKVRNVLSQV
jgi:hypothetical protein